MSRFGRLLITGIILLAVAGALTASAWQWRRLIDRRAQNHAVLEGRTLVPIDLATALRDTIPVEGRSIRARGRFLPGQEIQLRWRAQMDSPGVQVVSAFELEGGVAVIWVLRGFVASPDGLTPKRNFPSPDSITVDITGIAMPLPVTTDLGQPMALEGDTTWHRMDSLMLTRRIPAALPWYLHLTGKWDGPGKLPLVPPPLMDDGPHLSYAIQWIAIAMAILTFGWLMVWKPGTRDQG